MLGLTEWMRAFRPQERPWVLLGKGPSFARADEVDPQAWYTCALNHVVRERPVTVAHAIDLDVVLECLPAIERQARFLVLPWRPHVRFDPGPLTVPDLVREHPGLGRLSEAGRLVWYNLASSRPQGDEPRIEARWFSAEAALNLLVAAGVREVRSLGVDGGRQYAPSFADLEERTLLASGHASFDLQFQEIARTLRRSDVLYAPWGVEAPARVFVGADPPQRLAARVLEYSLRRQASLSVEVRLVDDAGLPVPRDPARRSRTGFSFGRFKIPALCGRRGRALYLDADMLALGDVRELWTLPFQGRQVLWAPQRPGRERARFSALLLDCAGLDWDAAEIVARLDRGEYGYADLMQELCVVPPDALGAGLPAAWNHAEHLEPGTRLIHYTDMPTQPWVHGGNPHGEPWYAALREALEEGFIRREELDQALAQGHVSPELPAWLGLGPPAGSWVRRRWVAPWRRLGQARRARDRLFQGLKAARTAAEHRLGLLRLPSPANGEHPPRDAYERLLEADPALREYPFLREAAKPGLAPLRSRLRSERAAWAAAPAAPGPVARLVVLADPGQEAALEATLRTWRLQSVPAHEVLVLQPGQPLGPAHLADDAFLIPARAGDLHHPSLVATLHRLRAARGVDVVCWHAQGPGRRPGSWLTRQAPERSPLSLWQTPCAPRAFAVRAGCLRQAGLPLREALDETEGHLLLLWLAGQPGLVWETHPEFLVCQPAPPPAPRPSPALLARYRELFAGRPELVFRETPGAAFPYQVRPRPFTGRVSVVVPFRDRPELTLRCLESVLRQELVQPPELVLVDNQSGPAARARLERWVRERGVLARWVEWDRPFNHSQQCNLGLAAATGQVALLLNNDAVLLDPGLLGELCGWALLPEVGTAGCRLVDAAGGLVSAGVRAHAERRAAWSAPVEESRRAAFSRDLRETVANSFACAALRREVWERAGPLDALGFPCGYDDVEYCLRLRALGYVHLYAGHLAVEHQPGTSRGLTDELPQLLELWRRYPGLLELGRRQLEEEERLLAPRRHWRDGGESLAAHLLPTPLRTWLSRRL